uniref:Uncharacterized protein n=1 Tax=uncultured marine virus TaxID=186617 RepID=A0A0F7L737_9VIRU|nr:hypothetical protein HCM2.0049c [uncultured marine virus]
MYTKSILTRALMPQTDSLNTQKTGSDCSSASPSQSVPSFILPGFLFLIPLGNFSIPSAIFI